MTPPKPRDVMEDIIERELPTYDSILRERDALKQENDKLSKTLYDLNLAMLGEELLYEILKELKKVNGSLDCLVERGND